MRTARILTALTGAFALAALAPSATAAPALRKQVDQNGDFVLFGNTLAHECAAGGTPPVPAPIVGTVGACGTNTGDSSPDVFWQSDAPAAGQAIANTSVTLAQARSTAVLQLPAGAKITYARIYWAGYLSASNAPADTTVRIERPSAALSTMVTADGSFTATTAGAGTWYQSTADVTALVNAQGPGPFRVGDVNNVNLPGFNSSNPVTAWTMVVFYELASEPPRNLALFDGLDLVQSGQPATVTLTGFLVPVAGFDAKLGVITYEGEADLTGDSLIFNGTSLTNTANPANNFFNGTRSFFGNPVTVVGDLPQLTGGPRSMSGIDMDVVNVTPQVAAGQTQATIQATSSQDRYFLGGFITSISTFKPNFDTTTKTFVDLNGGGIKPGDEIEYTVTIKNTGNDDSINTVMTDKLPAGITYVPGSISISSGPNAGAKTDATGDDQAEYVGGATNTITVRLGTGANATQGGTLKIGETTVVKFKVTINANASGTISNQAVVTAGGVKGAPPNNFPSDGNGNGPGAPPTDIDVDECENDAECTTPAKPFCKTTSSPKICVECVTSSQCTDAAKPDCNATTNKCECATGPNTCTDSDGDGLSDGAEAALGTDPNDADSDDDGVPDGAELEPGTDSDGDGVINALDPDSDNDGLFDGTELGLDCSNPATDKKKKSCVPDADQGATKTDPLNPDTDGGGVTDGSEDANLNGAIDAGETDPTSGKAADDATVTDTDGDGLSDALEAFLHSNPSDADSDDDGLLDGQEANPSADTDLDGLVNVLDVDSDNDALFDGTEMGKDCNDPATDKTKNLCIADNDGGATKTSPLLWDTDKGGVSDGSEDSNLNGIVDAGETDPTVGKGADDATVTDTDKDGLSDALEAKLGTNPNDADSDDDGLLDGEEANPGTDSDGDGKTNPLDEDSDGDGLFDGLEAGRDCSNSATDASKGTCTADGDNGATTTGVLNPDTDFGGVKDGDEDANKNGVVDAGELDPNDPSDDTIGKDCQVDADCGGPKSGVVCGATNKCEKGCRGSGGNGCPDGEQCTSTDNSIGQCVPTGTGGAGGGGGTAGTGATGTGATGGTGGSGTGGLNLDDGTLAGGGCKCSVPGGRSRDLGALLALLGLGADAARRRRR